MVMENKTHHALQATSVQHYTMADVCKKDLESYVHLANEHSSHSCYVDDALCELLHGDVW